MKTTLLLVVAGFAVTCVAVPFACAELSLRQVLGSTYLASERLIAVQHADGTWPWDITDMDAPAGVASQNVNGLIALGLLEVDEFLQQPDIHAAILETAGWIMAFQESNGWVYYQDAVFLAALSAVTGDEEYRRSGMSAMEYVNTVKRPTAQDVIDQSYASGKDVAFHLSWAIMANHVYGF
ncbi:hypothetical protein JW905_15305, partial [bacterium]|nr:hypothetical protein [candidate division CSSED10-310 bacterium]